MRLLNHKYYQYILILLFSFFDNCIAQTISTPIDVHFPIILKSLEYDRNLISKNSKVIKIGILYQEEYRTSLNLKNTLLEYISTNKIDNVAKVKTQFQLINFTNLMDLSQTIESGNFYAIYICPLRSVNVELIAESLIKNKILGVSGVSYYIKYKIPLVVDLNDNRPQIIIDLESSKASNIDFNSKLLKLSKVINAN